MAAHENEEHVISVKKENNLGFYRIHSLWQAGAISFNVASQTGAWSGMLSMDTLRSIGLIANIPQDKFLEETKAALTTPDGLPGFVYSVENGSFQWKKIIDEDAGVKVKMGSVPLEPAQFNDVIQNMMSVSLAKNQQLEKQVKELAADKGVIESKMNDIFIELDAAIKLKADIENHLTYFLPILNAKKTKISQLEEEIIKLKAKSGSSPLKRKARGRGPKVEIKEDPYGADTDEEMPLVESTNQPGPSRIQDSIPKLKKSSVMLRNPVASSSRTHLDISDDEMSLVESSVSQPGPSRRNDFTESSRMQSSSNPSSADSELSVSLAQPGPSSKLASMLESVSSSPVKTPSTVNEYETSLVESTSVNPPNNEEDFDGSIRQELSYTIENRRVFRTDRDDDGVVSSSDSPIVAESVQLENCESDDQVSSSPLSVIPKNKLLDEIFSFI